MKLVFVLLSAVFFSSCVHTALAPVSSPEGVQVVIRVPGVRPGQKATSAQLAAIDAKVQKEIMGKSEGAAKSDPAILSAGPMGLYGEVKTKRGEKFTGYMPVIVVRSTYPAEVVDRAAGQLAAAYYRGAKKHYQVYPFHDLVSQKPKP